MMMTFITDPKKILSGDLFDQPPKAFGLQCPIDHNDCGKFCSSYLIERNALTKIRLPFRGVKVSLNWGDVEFAKNADPLICEVLIGNRNHNEIGRGHV